MAYAQAASKGFEATRGMFENPNIDTSGMPSLRGIDMSKVSGIRGLNADGLQNIRGLTLDGLPSTALAPGQIAQDALLSRINPSLMADEESLRSRLANQGIGLGSAAYNREMGLQGQRATDLRLQAAAQGIGIDQAARQQALGERQAMSQFDMGLNAQQFGQRQAMSGFDMAQRNQQLGEREALSQFDMAQRNQQLGERQAMSQFDMAQRGQQLGERQALGQFDMAQRGQQFGERQAMSGFDMGLNAQQFGQQEALSNQAARQRGQMMEEAYAAQSRPLDLINSLRSGSQVKNPQFASYANQATTAGPDIMGAYNSAVQQGQFGQNFDMQQQQFQQALQQNQQNAKRASRDAMMGGLFSLGGAAMMSDRRLKTNIKPVGKTDGGLTVYTYNYIWGGPTQMGVMAQDVEKQDPSAVVEIDGFKAVDYSKVQ
jgi:hypothetical protein